MSAFADAAREVEQLTQRVAVLEARLEALTSGQGVPDRTAYRVPEAASRLGLHPQTIREWIKDGRLPAEDMGGWYAIPAEAVEAIGRRRSA